MLLFSLCDHLELREPALLTGVQLYSPHEALYLVTWLFFLQVDEKTDFNKLKVTQLKQLLKDRGVSCPECVEKNDYAKKARSLYVRGASEEL